MPTDTFSWLHLTDLHYGLKGQRCLWPNLRQPFFEDLAVLHDLCGPWDAVLFTGDLVQSGKSAQFQEMQAEVLDPLWEKLGELGSADAALLAVPGNHDLFRPAKGAGAVDMLLLPGGFTNIAETFWTKTDSDYRRVVSDAFAAYKQWWDSAPNRPATLATSSMPGDFSATIQCGERSIGIVGLNTTFLQLAGGDYRGRLVWDASQLHAICDGGVDVWSQQHDVCLLLTHQGPDWLTDEAREHGKSEVAPAGRFAAHLFGHQHETDITYISHGGSRNAVRLCQGCSVFGMENFGGPPKTQRAHGYTAGRIEFGNAETVLRLWPRMATNKTGGWRFIPNLERAELEKDEGTPPEPIAARPRAAAPPAKTAASTPRHKITIPAAAPVVHLSYAWGDDTSEGRLRDKAAEAIFAWLTHSGYDARRDKRDLKSGDLISTYERVIGRSDHVIVILSGKYLRSPYCMAELHNVYDRCLRDRDEFLKHVITVLLPNASEIRNDVKRLSYALYWKKQYEELDAAVNEVGAAAIGGQTLDRYHKTRDFWHKTDAILGFVADQLNPTGLEEIIADDFGVLRDRLPPPNATTTTTPAAAPHSTLPARQPFFGRADDLAKVAGYLHPDDRSWGVVIDGPGGVGKSALALEAAHRAPAEHFPLKLWITAKSRELLPEGEQRRRHHHVDDYYALLSELGRALGRDDVPSAVPEIRPDLVRHALANHRALLVLDNLETFSPQERRRAFELLGNLPAACRAIVTSRRRGGSSFAAHSLRLDKLEREAADELLAELGRHWDPVARLAAAERDQLYVETGGNPLLLTWTAGQLGRTTGRCRTVAEAVERLKEADRLHRVDPKNDPLDFIFGDLVETFTADETAVLGALVHFTRPAPIEWLLPLVELSPKAAETALDGLRDRALLVEDDQPATWLLPPLAARFLRRRSPEAVGASGERLADQAFALAVETGYQEFARYPVLEAAWPQLAAALPLLIASENHRLQTLCEALRDFLDFSGRWNDWLSLSTEAEAKAKRAKDFINAGRRAYDAGCCHNQRGQSAEVLACADRAAGHFQVARADAHERAIAIQLRGWGHTLAMNYTAAITAFREALDLNRSQSPKSQDVASGLNDLAGALRALGQFDEAETHYGEALAIAKALPYPEGVAYITGNLAELALDREQWPEAERLAREALKLAEDIGRRELIGTDCWRLAKALVRQGRGDEGRCHAERAVAIFTELRSPYLADAQATLAEC